MNRIVLAKPLPALVLAVGLLGGLPAPAQWLAARAQQPAPAAAATGTRSLKAALTELKTRYRVDILFEDRTIEGLSVGQTVPGNASDVGRQLESLLKPLGLRYKRVNATTYLVLGPKNSNRKDDRIGELSSPGAHGLDLFGNSASHAAPAVPEQMTTKAAPSSLAEHRITGRVTTEEKGEALPGVNVSIKGTTRGTTTDADGNYSLNVPDEGGTLVFSFIGYLTKEEPVGNRTVVNLSLAVDNKTLNEVVVIGYGSVKKSDVTGAVSQISSEVIANQPGQVDAAQALQGKVAGLDVVRNNNPGSNSTIAIRGYNSITGPNTPLIVLDGAPFAGSLTDINPAEIDKMDVLKDASSTAIYGSRGSNGVIIITTKRGFKNQHKISVTYDAFGGINKAFKRFDMMDGDRYADFKRMANYGKTDAEIFDAVALNAIQNKEYVNWQDLMFGGTGYQTDHNIGLNINGQNSSNMIVLGYSKQQSIIKNIAYDRLNARINGDLKISPKLALGYSTMLSHSVNDMGDPDNVFRYGNILDPLTKVYNDDGTLRFYPNGWYESVLHSNPLFDTDKANIERKTTRDRLFFNFFFNWDIARGLSFRSSLTPDWQFIETGQYWGPTTQRRHQSVSEASFSKASEKSLTFTNILNYKKEIGKHYVDASFVHDMQQLRFDEVVLGGQGMPYYGKWFNVNEAPSTFSRGSTFRQWRLLSFMGRVNYTFNGKYLVTLTARNDGSSRLAPGHQWALFPSAAVAWRLSDEAFLRPLTFVSDLKLRVSWGNTGNTAINPYQTLGGLGKYPYSFGTGEGAAIGYVPTELPNTELGWERTEEFNVGLDFGFLQNRITGFIDVYQRNTHDLLMARQLPITSGYNSTVQNIGKTRNSGVELTLNTVPVRRKNFEWNLNVTFAHNKNQITELYGGKNDDPGNRWFIGHPINVEWIYLYDGVWQYGQEEQARQFNYGPGEPRVKDIDGDGRYGQGDQVIFNRIPKWTGGLSSTFRYRNFDFNFYFYTRQDYGQRLAMLTDEPGSGSTRDNHLNVDFWTPTNPSNTFPKPRITDPQPLLVNSSYAFRDLSFVRLKTLNLGYNFPQQWAKRVGAERLRVYASVDNPAVWTMHRYEGLDPENGSSYTNHVPMTTFMLGLNTRF
ncbi:TonB-dependent receptor [Larkinella harenae]